MHLRMDSAFTSLIEYSEKLGESFNARADQNEKKRKGQYFTPPFIARMMADFVWFTKKRIRMLDPGAGLGILTCALCERVVVEKKNVELDVDLYENDPSLIPLLNSVMEQCEHQLRNAGHKFNYRIIQDDFIFSNAKAFDTNALDCGIYDLVISNPPYFKVSRNSEYSKIVNDYIHGQPNIYFMFMATAEKILKYGGQLIFITPRSYCSGLYFERFRQKFFSVMDPERFHLFDSRKDTFYNENVLQENIILSAIKRWNKTSHIATSCSAKNYSPGDTIEIINVKRNLVVDDSYADTLIRVPTTFEEVKLIELFDQWSENLSTMNMEISTGPVVSFRALDYIKPFSMEETYPLLCMRHIRDSKIVFPSDQKHNEGVIKKAQKKLMIPIDNYVVLKRFTSKEQPKRIQAAVLLKEDFDCDKIALENHLNYIYRLDGSLTVDEAIGIAGFLNCSIVDRYFRIVNGNTQVNASDIKALSFPSLEFLTKLGNNLYTNKIKYTDVDETIRKEFVGLATKTEEALEIIAAFGLKKTQLNERSALTLLALLDLKENGSWDKVSPKFLGTHSIMEFMKDHYDKVYAENTRETIRRQTLHQFEQALLVERNADNPERPTNSPHTVYSVTNEALKVIENYGTVHWEREITRFRENYTTLTDKYVKKRNHHLIPVTIKGQKLVLTPGKHNVLQLLIINEFASRFAPGSSVLYLGDTADKTLFVDEGLLTTLEIPVTKHDKMPDIVLYDSDKNWLFLIEAVTSHGPVSQKRKNEIEEMLISCEAHRIYVSAFLDMAEFKKHITEIAWDTEVWFADTPEHMLHFNGDRFLGPRQ